MSVSAVTELKQTLLREIDGLALPQMQEVLAYMRRLSWQHRNDISSASTRLESAAQAVLAWAARAEAETASLSLLDESVEEGELNEAPEPPFPLPRLSRVPRNLERRTEVPRT
jgi:hypothetical protein